MRLPVKLSPIWKTMLRHINMTNEKSFKSFQEYLRSLNEEEKRIEEEACYLATLSIEEKHKICKNKLNLSIH